jgi:hypothetical protein
MIIFKREKTPIELVIMEFILIPDLNSFRKVSEILKPFNK